MLLRYGFQYNYSVKLWSTKSHKNHTFYLYALVQSRIVYVDLISLWNISPPSLITLLTVSFKKWSNRTPRRHHESPSLSSLDHWSSLSLPFIHSESQSSCHQSSCILHIFNLVINLHRHWDQTTLEISRLLCPPCHQEVHHPPTPPTPGTRSIHLVPAEYMTPPLPVWTVSISVQQVLHDVQRVVEPLLQPHLAHNRCQHLFDLLRLLHQVLPVSLQTQHLHTRDTTSCAKAIFEILLERSHQHDLRADHLVGEAGAEVSLHDVHIARGLDILPDTLWELVKQPGIVNIGERIRHFHVNSLLPFEIHEELSDLSFISIIIDSLGYIPHYHIPPVIRTSPQDPVIVVASQDCGKETKVMIVEHVLTGSDDWFKPCLLVCEYVHHVTLGDIVLVEEVLSVTVGSFPTLVDSPR